MQSHQNLQITKWTPNIDLSTIDLCNDIIIASDDYISYINKYNEISSLSQRKYNIYEYLYKLHLGYLPTIQNDIQLNRLHEILPDWFSPVYVNYYHDYRTDVGFIPYYSTELTYMGTHIPELQLLCDTYPKQATYVPPALIKYDHRISIIYQTAEDKPTFATHDMEDDYFYVASSGLYRLQTPFYVHNKGSFVEDIIFPKGTCRFSRLCIWKYKVK